jgi:hypothetical protein
LPNSLRDLYYHENPIHNFIKQKFDDDWKKYNKWQIQYRKKFANKIGNWFLECKYNPQYKYCQNRLNHEYDQLYC